MYKSFFENHYNPPCSVSLLGLVKSVTHPDEVPRLTKETFSFLFPLTHLMVCHPSLHAGTKWVGKKARGEGSASPPKSLQMEQSLRRVTDTALPCDRVGEERITVGAKSFFIHPDSQDKALISQQAAAALKLLVVLVCFP